MTTDPSGRCAFHRNPTDADLAREETARQREEERRREARRRTIPRTIEPRTAFDHARAARHANVAAGRFFEDRDDSWVPISSLEESIADWATHIPDLIAYARSEEARPIEVTAYLHTAGSPGGSFAQSGYLMVDWIPTGENIYSPDAISNRRNMCGQRINRLIEIPNFERTIELALEDPNAADPVRQRAAAHVVAGVTKHLDEVTKVIAKLLPCVFRQLFDVEVTEEVDYDAQSDQRLTDFRIKSVNWFDPEDRVREQEDERRKWQAERALRAEQDFLGRVAKTLPCPPEQLLSIYVTHDRDLARTGLALRASGLKLAPSRLRDALARLEKLAPQLWARTVHRLAVT